MEPNDLPGYWNEDSLHFSLDNFDNQLVSLTALPSSGHAPGALLSCQTPPPGTETGLAPHAPQQLVMSPPQGDPTVAMLVPAHEIQSHGNEHTSTASVARPHSPCASLCSSLYGVQSNQHPVEVPLGAGSGQIARPHPKQPYATSSSRPLLGTSTGTRSAPVDDNVADESQDHEAESGSDTDVNLDSDMLPADPAYPGNFSHPELSNHAFEHGSCHTLQTPRAVGCRDSSFPSGNCGSQTMTRGNNNNGNCSRATGNTATERMTERGSVAPVPQSPSRSATVSRLTEASPRTPRAGAPAQTHPHDGGESLICSPILYKSEDALLDGIILHDLKGTTAARSRKMTEQERNIMLVKRRLRNRQSAARSREKQRNAVADLTEKVGELTERLELALAANAQLRDDNGKLAEALANFKRFA